MPGLVPAEPVELAVQHEQRLVAGLVDVRRRREAGRRPVIDDAQLALAVLAADLVNRQGVEEPEWLPFVGRYHEAIGMARFCVCISCLLLAIAI